MNERNQQRIAFTEEGLSLDVRVDAEKETVQLTQAEMAEFFDVDRTRITRHVNSILHDDEVDAESNVRKTHFANSDRPTSLYGLDMIFVVGYHANSKHGIAFEASTYEESSVVRCEINVSPRDLFKDSRIALQACKKGRNPFLANGRFRYSPF